MAHGRAGSDSEALVLGADLGASAVQLLQHALDLTGTRITVLLVAAVRCPGRKTATSAGLVWQEFYCADSAIRYRVLAGMRRCGPRVRTADPHCTLTHFCITGGPQLRVLTIQSLLADANLAIAQARAAAACSDALSTWETEVLSPGRGPGVQGIGIGAVLAHTLTFHGAAAQQTMSQMLAELTSQGNRLACALISEWAESEAADAVLVPVPRGAIPVAVAALDLVASRFRTRPVFMGDSLFVLGASPACFDAHRDFRSEGDARAGHGATPAPPWAGRAKRELLNADCALRTALLGPRFLVARGHWRRGYG